jgi:glycosyltransferase involved in cell wall biosynthesis
MNNGLTAEPLYHPPPLAGQLEAFLARKPVITTGDAGGPLEFVEEGVTSLVVEPSPETIGAAIARPSADHQLARSLGDAGYDRVRSITWDGVVDRLRADGDR